MLIKRKCSLITLTVQLTLIWSFDTQRYRGLQINVDDILNENLMPVRLFTQHYRKLPKNPSENNNVIWKSTLNPSFSNCTDFCAALSTMEFHR